MNRNEKIKRLKENLPLFWSSYQHMYDVRERKAKGKIDFLLLISTFLPILSITLYSTNLFSNILILLPIIPQIISIVILLKYFAVDMPAVHWFKLDQELLGDLETENFEIKTIAVLKKLEKLTWTSMKGESKLIKKSSALIIFSLFASFLSILFILFKGNLYFYLTCTTLIIIFFYVFFNFYSKEHDFSKIEKEEEKDVQLLRGWINKKNEKRN